MRTPTTAEARATYELLRTHGEDAGLAPNEHTYFWLLGVVVQVAEEDEFRTLVRDVFRRCCEDGCCCERTLQFLWKKLPEDLWDELFADVREDAGCPRIEELPPSWILNSEREW